MNKITAIALLVPMTFAYMYASSNKNHDLELYKALTSSNLNKTLDAYDNIQKQTGNALKHEISNLPLPNFVTKITFKNILNSLQILNFILSKLNSDEAKLVLSNTINNYDYNLQINNILQADNEKEELTQIRKLIKNIGNLLKKKK